MQIFDGVVAGAFDDAGVFARDDRVVEDDVAFLRAANADYAGAGGGVCKYLRRRLHRGLRGPREGCVWSEGDALFGGDVDGIVSDERLAVDVGAVGRAEVFDFEMAIGVLA
jgi:hypothetical protein